MTKKTKAVGTRLVTHGYAVVIELVLRVSKILNITSTLDSSYVARGRTIDPTCVVGHKVRTLYTEELTAIVSDNGSEHI